TFEPMMQDGRALQAGTSHFLGQTFAKSADIKFQSKTGGLEYVYTTSWGVSTRLIGGLIMSHADDEGMVTPPMVAPYQVVIVPMLKDPAKTEAVMAYAEKLRAALAQHKAFDEKIRVKLDTRDKSSTDKYWEWTRKGVPVIVEVGPRDMEGTNVMVRERIKIGTPEGKQVIAFDAFADTIENRLENIQRMMYEKAEKRLKSNIRTDIKTPEQMQDYFANQNVWLGSDKPTVAFVRGKWCGDEETLEKMKEMKITIRCIPFDQTGEEGVCLISGKPAVTDVIYARSY
ncbi:MAG: His/Gly/Thr/Pro-type tRNA ligase C-terminal domain-containing protein, partial [Alphaproteobacteria bacterium]